MSKQTGFWSGLQDKNGDEHVLKEAIEKEFVTHVPIADAFGKEEVLEESKASRRDFLKYLGFSLGAATVAASCEIPVKRAIPYVIKPDDIVPGVANYYASTFVDEGFAMPILVKTREGRPIKIEGNALYGNQSGGTNARAQASVLSLYDTNRYFHPLKRNGQELGKMSWADMDKEIKEKLSQSKGIRIISNTINSPSSLKSIESFVLKHGNAGHLSYDPISHAAQLEANQQSFGIRALPNYDFSKAKTILSFDADFLATWISPVEFSGDYAKNRKIKDVHHPTMSRHIQVESRMSYTGSNADERVLVKPSEMPAAVAYLYGLLGGTGVNAPAINEKAQTKLSAIAKELMSNRGETLVVSGVNDLAIQLMVNKINDLLGNWGTTLDMNNPSYQKLGDERQVNKVLEEINSGAVDAVILWNCNPAFDLPNGEEWSKALAGLNTSIALAYSPSESSESCTYIAPIHHMLESWGDAQMKKNDYSFIQPTIAPLFDTRQAELSLLSWADGLNGEVEEAYYNFVRSTWQEKLAGSSDFEAAWMKMVQDGIYVMPAGEEEAVVMNDVDMSGLSIASPSNAELEISLYETINIGSGNHADNPWLQEMPDPIMRTVWGNYLAIPISFNGKDKFDIYGGFKSEGKGSTDVVSIDISGREKSLPVVPQFGQMSDTVAVGLGYGRKTAGKCGLVGEEVNSCLSYDSNGFLQYWTDKVNIKGLAGEDNEFACVQYHHTYGVTAKDEEGIEFNADEAVLGYQGALLDRSIMRYGTLDDLESVIHDISEQRSNAEHLNVNTLYPSYEDKYKEGHHWSMYVDMNACTGCGACTISCMAENNVPVVGKKEVHRHHEMSWIRIDRYYFGDAENPNVVYQPMMCQHCDNAPCENVCPVAATNHSSEGLNQMTYNRCIGTRYCANNCPYKVRRFNWLDYTSADLFGGNENYINEDSSIPFSADNLTRMVLNPDVTVRSRGVIEKCSFCVQRIQEGKLMAKREHRPLQDGEIKTACQTACPTGAIIFGDDNDKNSAVSKAIESPLVYKVLEEVNTASSVNYSAKVVNKASLDNV